MVIIDFLLQDKLGRIWFLEETIFLADASMEVILGIIFLTFLDVDIRFAENKLVRRRFIAAKALPIIKGVELIDRRKFASTTLNKNKKTFLVYNIILIGSDKEAEILILPS